MAKKRKLTDIEQEYVDSINPTQRDPNALPASRFDFFPERALQTVEYLSPNENLAAIVRGESPPSQPSAMDGIAGRLSAIRNNGIGN
jgi:hypothetical protein